MHELSPRDSLLSLLSPFLLDAPPRARRTTRQGASRGVFHIERDDWPPGIQGARSLAVHTHTALASCRAAQRAHRLHCDSFLRSVPDLCACDSLSQAFLPSRAPSARGRSTHAVPHRSLKSRSFKAARSKAARSKAACSKAARSKPLALPHRFYMYLTGSPSQQSPL